MSLGIISPPSEYFKKQIWKSWIYAKLGRILIKTQNIFEDKKFFVKTSYKGKISL